MTVDNIKGDKCIERQYIPRKRPRGQKCVCASATKYWESKEGRIEQRTGVVRVEASTQR